MKDKIRYKGKDYNVMAEIITKEYILSDDDGTLFKVSQDDIVKERLDKVAKERSAQEDTLKELNDTLRKLDELIDLLLERGNLSGLFSTLKSIMED